MDNFTIMNIAWGAILIISVMINYVIGFKMGANESYNLITEPIVKHLINKYNLIAKNDDGEGDLTAKELIKYLLSEIYKIK